MGNVGSYRELGHLCNELTKSVARVTLGFLHQNVEERRTKLVLLVPELAPMALNHLAEENGSQLSHSRIGVSQEAKFLPVSISHTTPHTKARKKREHPFSVPAALCDAPLM